LELLYFFSFYYFIIWQIENLLIALIHQSGHVNHVDKKKTEIKHKTHISTAVNFYKSKFVCPFVFYLLAIVLSVLLRFTDSDYCFGIFKLFLIQNNYINTQTNRIYRTDHVMSHVYGVRRVKCRVIGEIN
jgi:hypothetical protein